MTRPIRMAANKKGGAGGASKGVGGAGEFKDKIIHRKKKVFGSYLEIPAFQIYFMNSKTKTNQQ